MKRLLWRALTKNAAVSTGLARALYPPPPPPPPGPRDERVRAWIEAEGDRTLRVDYDLDETSLVWDVGGYRGDWASDIFSRYRCRIEIFEPVADFARLVQARFERNPTVTVHAYGLAGTSRRETITLEADASSTYTFGERLEEIELVDVVRQIERSGAESIDLVKINVEGGEYELLERLIESGHIRRVRRLQVQFHDFVPDAERRMSAVQDALASTHERCFAFPWVWEGWERRA